ncbi:MAG: hypothetical protein Q8S05_06990 [Sulfuricella sp.]|nr:hypothetical protein [Sulfuricella sp.]
MQPSPQIVFVARGLTKTYHMGEVEVPALRALDIEIYQGEFIVLPGPSGSSKSTLKPGDTLRDDRRIKIKAGV